MKISNLFLIFFTLILLQCNNPKEKFNPSDFVESDCPITDLITEVPALEETTIQPIVLEDEDLKVVFDKNSGRLVQMVSKKSGWIIQRRESLSRSFRLAIPVEGRRDHTIYGERQTLTDVALSDNHKRITFTWNKLVSDCGKTLDIEFSGIVELSQQGLEFTATIENNSPYIVESVYWPYLGDVNVPKDQKKLDWMHFEYGGGLQKDPVYPSFRNHKGYWGVDYPIQMYKTQYSQFGLLGNDREGIYVGYHDPSDTRFVNFAFELKPGYEHGGGMNFMGTVPKSDEISGQPVHIEYSCIHFTFVNPNESATLEPIVIKPYKGDWQRGADHYKAYRKTWYKPLAGPEWAQKIHSWQQFHMNSSEDYPRCTYKDLVNLGKECAKHGIKAIELVGWTLGGQDRGNPSHDIDPRLGTWEDLKYAIDECKKMGVHIILFTKFTWADKSQPWFKNELIKHSIKDPYGNYYSHPGYQYQTAVQLAGINSRELVPMCMLDSDWRDIVYEEFIKTIDLGAPGMLYDECQHHASGVYCFDPHHGHAVPGHVFSGDKMLEDGFRDITGEKDPDYLIVGESIRDLQFKSYHMTYFRMGRDYTPIHRYVAPDANMIMAVTGYNDRHPINQALLYRFIISYEPRHFKGQLTEFPLTLEYGKKVDAFREKYSDFLWDGEFVGTVGATVKADNSQRIHYSVFINHKTGKHAIVVANPSATDSVVVKAELDNGTDRFLKATPEAPEPIEVEGKIEIPVHSAIVLFEG